MTWVQIRPPVGEKTGSHDLVPPPSLSMLLSTCVQCEDREVLILQGSERLMSLYGWKEPAAVAGLAHHHLQQVQAGPTTCGRCRVDPPLAVGAGSDHLFLLPLLFFTFLPFSVLLPGHGKVCPQALSQVSYLGFSLNVTGN